VSLRSGIARVRRSLTAADDVAEMRAQLNAVRRVVLELQTFDFRDRTYRYFASDYNRTWTNERAVELPIARQAVREAGGGAVLEVGNVLRRYFPELKHRVVDKYERTGGVENIDVLDIRGRYDLIVSVSTIEHVGHDAKRGVTGAGEGEPGGKAVDAIRHLQDCLAPGGRLLFTVPLGYNRVLDEAIACGIPGVDTFFLLRLDRENRWAEADWATVAGTAYGHPFPAANALVVGEARP
jgi:SAM-dependent methyltransferase